MLLILMVEILTVSYMQTMSSSTMSGLFLINVAFDINLSKNKIIITYREYFSFRKIDCILNYLLLNYE